MERINAGSPCVLGIGMHTQSMMEFPRGYQSNDGFARKCEYVLRSADRFESSPKHFRLRLEGLKYILFVTRCQ